MMWNKPTLRKRFESLDFDARNELLDFLFTRFLLSTSTDHGHVDEEVIRVVLNRAVQLYTNPEKMGISIECTCPSCAAPFSVDLEDPIYICPNCASALDRCDWLTAIVFDYMKREILYSLIDQEPARANDLLKMIGRTPDQPLTRATVASFKFGVLELLRDRSVPVSEVLLESSRRDALRYSIAGIIDQVCKAVSASSSSRSGDREEANHESDYR